MKESKCFYLPQLGPRGASLDKTGEFKCIYELVT